MTPVSRLQQRGFTLLELLVVVTLIAVGSATVALTLRDSAQTDLERDGARLSAWLEAGRAHSRSSGQAVRWHARPEGFRFDGWTGHQDEQKWLGPATVAADGTTLTLGPEPIIGAQSVRLSLRHDPKLALTVSTDGLQPFVVGDGK